MINFDAKVDYFACFKFLTFILINLLIISYVVINDYSDSVEKVAKIISICVLFSIAILDINFTVVPYRLALEFYIVEHVRTMTIEQLTNNNLTKISKKIINAVVDEQKTIRYLFFFTLQIPEFDRSPAFISLKEKRALSKMISDEESNSVGL